jgi:transcriptional regulator with XRE-family HTH domain
MQAPRGSHEAERRAMPRQRRWEPNKRLVHERERRGWSQEDAAREAEKVADRLGQPDLVFTGPQFGRWERGECRPRPPLRRVVCELYEASAEALGCSIRGTEPRTVETCCVTR